MNRFPYNSTQSASSEKVAFIRALAAELVSKTLGSEGKDVRLKPALSSVCHPDLTQGELFVAGVFSACLSDWG